MDFSCATTTSRWKDRETWPKLVAILIFHIPLSLFHDTSIFETIARVNNLGSAHPFTHAVGCDPAPVCDDAVIASHRRIPFDESPRVSEYFEC